MAVDPNRKYREYKQEFKELNKYREGSIAWLLVGLSEYEAAAFLMFVLARRSCRKVARVLQISHESVRRLVKSACRHSHTYDLTRLLKRRSKM